MAVSLLKSFEINSLKNSIFVPVGTKPDICSKNDIATKYRTLEQRNKNVLRTIKEKKIKNNHKFL